MVDTTGQSDVDYYYAQDHLYSSTVLIEDDGDVIERYEYDAYGNVYIMDGNYNSRSSTLYDNPYTFTGRRLDSLDSGNLNIMYYRHRSYHPQLGRFMSVDPLGFADGYNLFEYVRSNPLIFRDSHGMISSTNCLGQVQNALNSKEAQEIIKAVDKKCHVPYVTCCSSCTDPGGCGSNSTWGGYWQPGGPICICNDNLTPDHDIKEVVIHELIHAYDDCYDTGPNGPCQKAACSEIRAYHRDGGCRHRADYAECIKERATSSLQENKGCASKARQYVEEVFLDCFTNFDPFDRPF